MPGSFLCGSFLHQCPGRHKGFSLVELMISLALGSVMAAGIMQLFVASSDTWALLQGQSRIQESARLALELVRRDIHSAGYRGCFSGNDALHWTMNDPASLPYEFDLRFGVAGYEATGQDTWMPSLDELPGAASTSAFVSGTGIDTDAIISGTDVITLRAIRREPVQHRLSRNVNAPGEAIELARPSDATDDFGLDELDIALIHDCEKATLFHVTALDDRESGIRIEYARDPALAWRNDSATLAIKNSFGTDAVVSAIVASIYYIAPGAGENADGDNPLSLWRKQGKTRPVELVEGIEDLQFLYGTGSDNLPEQYLPASEVTAWKSVVAIRITVVANSIDDVGGTMKTTQGCSLQKCHEGEPEDGIDGLIRRSFSQTVTLRNRS